MKVSKEKIEKFDPVTVVIESKAELFHLLTILNRRGNEVEKQYNKDFEENFNAEPYIKLNHSMFSLLVDVDQEVSQEWHKELKR